MALIALLTLTILIAIPHLINYLVLKGKLLFDLSRAGVDDVERSWLMFWSNYFGCVVSSIVTFVVLYLTLKQNNKENNKNREEAHKENSLLREYQDKTARYERFMRYVSEIRTAAVSMYHSIVNSSTDEIYSMITLDKGDEFDLKRMRGLLLSVLDDAKRSYVEMSMLLSYESAKDDEAERLMRSVEKTSDELYDCIRDLIGFYFLCRGSSEMSKEAIKAEIYKSSKQNETRVRLPDYKYIWDIIIDEKLMDIQKNRSTIAIRWHDEWLKAESIFQSELKELVSHYYKKAQEIIE